MQRVAKSRRMHSSTGKHNCVVVAELSHILPALVSFHACMYRYHHQTYWPQGRFAMNKALSACPPSSSTERP